MVEVYGFKKKKTYIDVNIFAFSWDFSDRVPDSIKNFYEMFYIYLKGSLSPTLQNALHM